MKKTKIMVLSTILLCGACMLFMQIKVHSMDYSFDDISGDRSALEGSNLTIALRNPYTGSDENRFLLSIKDGRFTYQYEEGYEAYEQRWNEANDGNYFRVDFYDENLTFDQKDFLESKTADGVYITDYPEAVCTDYIYALDSASLSVMASLKDDEYTGYYESAYRMLEELPTQLKINSTEENPLVKVKETCEGANDDRERNFIQYKDGNGYYQYEYGGAAYLAGEQYYGMINIYPRMEGSADIYRFDTKQTEDIDQTKTLELTPIKSIPIKRGTTGFLYKYKDTFYTILQKDDVMYITAYDTDFNVVKEEQLPIPWMDERRDHFLDHFANEDKITFLYGDSIYTLDVSTMQFVDDLTVGKDKVMDIEDILYRNDKYYILAPEVPDDADDHFTYGTNQLLSVYKDKTCLYQGRINMRDIKIKEEQGIDRIYRHVDTSNNLDYIMYYAQFTRDAS